MTLRLVIHAGFHKTGTGSVQKMLKRNRKTLAPCLRIVLRPDIIELCEATRAFSVRDTPDRRNRLRGAWLRFLAALDHDDARPVLISSEDLAGHMPGRRGIMEYTAAPPIMAEIDKITQEALPHAELTVFFSTRAPGPWVDSCYAQHVRVTRITDAPETYRATYLPHADLSAIVDQVAAAVPRIRVVQEPLEISKDKPLGPLDPLLDLCGIGPGPRVALKDVGPANPAPPPDVLAMLVDLNRSGLADKPLAAAKQAMLKSWRRRR